MITKEQKILNQQASRLELRERLKSLTMEFWDTVDLDDIVAELNRLHAQTVTFIGNNAWERMQEEDKKHDNIS